MNHKVTETTVSINTVKIGRSALKKSHLEQMPFIKEQMWRGEINEDVPDLSVFCTFPFVVLADISQKTNKNRCSENKIYLQSLKVDLDGSDWQSNLGVVLYSRSKKAFLISSYHEMLSVNNRNCFDSKIHEIRENIDLINSFLKKPTIENLAKLANELNLFFSLKSIFNEEYKEFTEHFKEFDAKYNKLNVAPLDFSSTGKRNENDMLSEENSDLDYSGFIELFEVDFSKKLLDFNLKNLEQITQEKEQTLMAVHFEDATINNAPYLSFV